MKTSDFLRKRQSRRLDRCCLQGIENSLSWQLVAGVNSNFLSLCKATGGITGNSTELFDWIFIFQKVWLEFRKRAILTARQRSLDFRLSPHGLENSLVDNHGLDRV